MKQTKLSLMSAILININIMLGSGIFINTAILTKQSGSLGASVYIIVAILLLPLIMAMAQLLRHLQGTSTFYHIGLTISPFFGFISSWSYFIAKLCSCALGIHVCISFLQKIVPILAKFPTLTLDLFVILLFTCLNLLNLRTGKVIQQSFIMLKLVPILFAIFTGFYLFNSGNFTKDMLIFSGIPTGIPLVLYAFSGFEASCSLSQCIENPEKNGPKAILISFAIVVSLVVLYQLMFFGALGSILGSLTDGYLGIFPALLNKLSIPFSGLKIALLDILHLGIAASSLGSSYGIMYSNSWNLHTLASANHVFAKKLFTALNNYNVPFACILAEGLLAVIYLLITKGQQIPLQQVSALGSTIAYTCSSIALLTLLYKNDHKSLFLPIFSLISCALLLSSFIYAVYTKGISTLLLLFLFVIFLGSVMFFKRHNKPDKLDVFEKI